jgi:hypothetical protein
MRPLFLQPTEVERTPRGRPKGAPPGGAPGLTAGSPWGSSSGGFGATTVEFVSCEFWLVRDGVLLAGQDLWWHLERVEGHDRHVWIMDEWEFGAVVASALHMENVWVKDGAASMVRYYDEMERADRWLESPEGRAALDAAAAKVRKTT